VSALVRKPMPRKRKSFLGRPPTHKGFRPYVTAIGQAAIAWNGLHEALRDLFWLLSNGNKPTSSAIWYSIKSDRSQRDMIRAIANSHVQTGDISQIVFKRIDWLLGQCDTIANARNDMVHSPLIFSEQRGVYPNTYAGNPLAKRLLNKELLSEFRWCREAALTLTDFAMRLHINLLAEDSAMFPFPEIPAMPNRGQKKRPSHKSMARS
jgi:hypothetical protein